MSRYEMLSLRAACRLMLFSATLYFLADYATPPITPYHDADFDTCHTPLLIFSPPMLRYFVAFITIFYAATR